MTGDDQTTASNTKTEDKGESKEHQSKPASVENEETRVQDEEGEKLYELLTKLKYYAINNGYKISDDLIYAINNNREIKSISETERHIRDLTNITFPTTIDHFENVDPSAFKRFSWLSFSIGIVGIVGAFVTISTKGPAILAALMGLLGAVVYTLFGFLGVIPQSEFNRSDEFAGYTRLTLGLLLGFVFYASFAVAEFENFMKITGGDKNSDSTNGAADVKSAALLMLPFLAGYSTTLVVGLLGKVIQSIEITLGLEDVRDRRTKSRRQPEGVARRTASRES